MFASDYRAQAREALRSKWKRVTLLVFLAMLLGAGSVSGISYGSSSGASFSASDLEMLFGSQASVEMRNFILVSGAVGGFLSLWTFFLGSFVRVGLVNMLCRTIQGEQPRAGMLFPRGLYWKSLGLSFVKGVFVFLWSLLFVIPGIIAAYRYSMADYILCTRPETGIMEAIAESKARMHGRKWRMFCLEFSFIGWQLLAMLPGWLLAMAGSMFYMLPIAETQTELTQGLAAPMLGLFAISGLLMLVASMFVQAYMNTALVTFFRDADRAGTWRSEAREGEEYAETTYGEPAWGENWNSAHGQTAPVESALSADETVARDMFEQHGCSRALLREEGLLEEYLALNPSPISEARWIRDYGDRLMRRFDGDPSALDGLLDLSAEYAVADLLNRVLSRIERHLRNQTLPDAEIVNMCGRVLALLASGRFDGDPGFVSRKKEQIADMADRLEHRLAAAGAEGDWAESIALIRRMCG